MIRKSEVLWVQGWEEKIGGIIREERVGAGKTRGDNTGLSAGWLGAERKGERGRALDSLRNLEVPSGVRGAKGQGSLTFDPDPPFS